MAVLRHTLGYFKRHFVDNLKWLNAERYAQLISLSQALPGPGSSQVSFAMGVEKRRSIGRPVCICWLYSTLIFNYVFSGTGAHQFGDIYFAVVAGLKLFAMVIVADATYSMAMSFCKTIYLNLSRY